MAGLVRFVRILQLFDERKPNWTVHEIADALSVPASTIYRTVRELVQLGFLDPSFDAHYRLGAVFIDFDRRLRTTDPLIREGTPLLDDLVKAAQVPCAAVVARLHGSRVICVTDAHSPDARIGTSYERGRAMPLLRGATSKAILAQLPKAQLRKVLTSNGQEGPPSDGEDIARELGDIRRKGFAITRGEVDKGLAGISAPMSSRRAAVNASIGLIVRSDDLQDGVERRLLMLLIPAANLLSEQLEAIAARP